MTNSVKGFIMVLAISIPILAAMFLSLLISQEWKEANQVLAGVTIGGGMILAGVVGGFIGWQWLKKR